MRRPLFLLFVVVGDVVVAARLAVGAVRGDLGTLLALQLVLELVPPRVDGLALQLDRLYETDVIDISGDIQVLEQMMARDGLSIGKGNTVDKPCNLAKSVTVE